MQSAGIAAREVLVFVWNDGRLHIAAGPYGPAFYAVGWIRMWASSTMTTAEYGICHRASVCTLATWIGASVSVRGWFACITPMPSSPSASKAATV